jgi:hypothetical protein
MPCSRSSMARRRSHRPVALDFVPAGTAPMGLRGGLRAALRSRTPPRLEHDAVTKKRGMVSVPRRLRAGQQHDELEDRRPERPVRDLVRVRRSLHRDAPGDARARSRSRTNTRAAAPMSPAATSRDSHRRAADRDARQQQPITARSAHRRAAIAGHGAGSARKTKRPIRRRRSRGSEVPRNGLASVRDRAMFSSSSHKTPRHASRCTTSVAGGSPCARRCDVDRPAFTGLGPVDPAARLASGCISCKCKARCCRPHGSSSSAELRRRAIASTASDFPRRRRTAPRRRGDSGLPVALRTSSFHDNSVPDRRPLSDTPQPPAGRRRSPSGSLACGVAHRVGVRLARHQLSSR